MTKNRMLLMGVAAVLAAGCGDSGGGAAPAGDKVGVAECDDYLAKMSACLAKMDPAARAATEPTLAPKREAWKSGVAAGGAAKDGVRQVCAMTLESMPPECK